MHARDITSACTLLLIAGHETTTSLIPIVLWCLDEHPEAREELARHPELLSGVIEESLRLRAVIHYMPRVVSRDVEFEGCRLRPGDLVPPLFAAANLDARQFRGPITLTFDARPIAISASATASTYVSERLWRASRRGLPWSNCSNASLRSLAIGCTNSRCAQARSFTHGGITRFGCTTEQPLERSGRRRRDTILPGAKLRSLTPTAALVA